MKRHIIVYLIYFTIEIVKLSQIDWFQIDFYFIHYILFYYCYLKLTITITQVLLAKLMLVFI